MRLTIQVIVYLFICAAFSIFAVFLGNEGANIATADDMDVSASLPISSLQLIPRVDDVVHCEDGSTYRIQDVSQYQQPPANPALASLFADAFSASVPKADVIHFTDISGDYLFVKNRYEMYRMLYTLSQSAIAETEDVLLSIPDDAIPMVLDSWNPEWLVEFQRSHSNKICCLESWDMYKDGSYLRTVYLAAAI